MSDFKLKIEEITEDICPCTNTVTFHILVGSIEADVKYQVIFEEDDDITLYREYDDGLIDTIYNFYMSYERKEDIYQSVQSAYEKFYKDYY